MAKRKGFTGKNVKPKNVVITVSNKKHILMLYALIVFTWIMILSMFTEKTGGFIINFRATFFGLIIGIGAASLIYHTDRNLK